MSLVLVTEFFGQLEPPPGVEHYGEGTGSLIVFLNNILKLVIFAAAFIALLNLLISGIEYIGSSGNPETAKRASSRIWMSLLGLVIVAGSILIAALIGLIFFGDSRAILFPNIPGATPSP
jgi:hypothetical protein